MTGNCRPFLCARSYSSFQKINDINKSKIGGTKLKIRFPLISYICRPKYYTYEIKVYLPEYGFVSKKLNFDC